MRNEKVPSRERELSTQELIDLVHRRDPLATGDRSATTDKSELKHISEISREAGFPTVAGKGQYFATMPSVLVENGPFVAVYRECTEPRDRREAELACGVQDNARIGRALNVTVTHVRGRHSVEVQLLTKLNLG